MSANRLAGLALIDGLADDPRVIERLAEAVAERLRPAPTIYTTQTLAAEVGCSPEAVGRAIRTGELAATRRAGRWVIAAGDVEQWARSGARPVIRSARRADLPGRRGPADTPGSLALLRGARNAS